MQEGGTTMVSDEDIAEALESLLRESNPNSTLNSITAVVQQLESKLGLELSQKVDFIRSQIHRLLRPQPPPFNHIDHISLHQNPNYHPSPSQIPPNFHFHRPEEYGYRPQQPQQKTEAFTPGVAGNGSPPVATAAAVPESSKERVQPEKKRKGGAGGLNKLCAVSPELQTIVGQARLPRTEIVKQLWAYIRKNNLQDPSNKRKIVCNDELRLVFETDCTDMFKMNKLLAKHIVSLEPAKQTGQSSKKSKVVEVESEGGQSVGSVPIVIVSETLSNFFGTDEKEMSQPEVLRRVWEYVKVNQLEDPLNPMMILCDPKLQELLGCESISALGIPEMVARHHLYKRS